MMLTRLLLDEQPARLIDWYASVNDTRKAFVQARAALADIPLAEAHDLLLRSLEALCKVEVHEPRLFGLVSSLCPQASEQLDVRRRSLDVALGMSKAAPSASLTLMSNMGVREEDATAEQVEGLQEFGHLLSEQENWDQLVRYLIMFPHASESSGITANATIDKLARASEFHLALKLAEGFDMGRRARGLRLEMRETKIRDAVKSGRPIKGIHVCGRNPVFRRLFLELLLQEGMTQLASHYSKVWGLKLNLRPTHWRLERMRRNNHFQMPRNVKVQHISSTDDVPAAFDKLKNSKLIGLDTESHHRGGLTLLQLASHDHVLLIDLLQLSGCAVLGGLLAKLFSDRNVTKLSFGGVQDVKMVAKLPGFPKSWELEAHVDIQRMAAEQRAEKEEISVKQALHGLGLASLSEGLLGKPMNKEMTASNWAARPLSKAQAEYAALDAWILVRMFRKLNLARFAEGQRTLQQQR